MQRKQQKALALNQSYSSKDLGQRLNSYRVSGNNTWLSGILGGILVSLAFVLTFYSLVDTLVQMALYGPVSVGLATPLLLVAAVALFLVGTLVLKNVLSRWNKSLVIYEKGLAILDGNTFKLWLWQDVEYYYVSSSKYYFAGIPITESTQLVLYNSNREVLKITNELEHIGDLGRLIGQKVTPYQIERMNKSILAGQKVKLGPIVVAENFLALKKIIYSWDSIESIQVIYGKLIIKTNIAGWFKMASIPISAIPNLDALLAVVTQKNVILFK